MNPAVWEISGHIVLKKREDFDNASEEYAWKLLSEVSLSEVRFTLVKKIVLEASGLQGICADGNNIKKDAEEDALQEPCGPAPCLLKDHGFAVR